ncbi:MAG: M4 family metallopeptidase [Lentisphaerae bacterium]|nr:M4 family metallopeptidase [Lentisphaerota bacterium]MCP4103626.1 M4 family metallopeptidase [Lentisphaerota bacterium]
MLKLGPECVLKTLTVILLLNLTGLAYGNTLILRDADSSKLKDFRFTSSTIKNNDISKPTVNSFALVSKDNAAVGQVIRYQQRYCGIEVYGAQVIINNKRVNGRLEKGIEDFISREDVEKYNCEEKISHAIDGAYPFAKHTTCKLIVYTEKNNGKTIYRLAFLISGISADGPEATVTDARTGEVIKKWRKIAGVDAYGIGGNYNTGKYCYGRAKLPFMPVNVSKGIYTLENDDVKVVDLHHFNGEDIDGNYVWGPAHSWSGRNYSGASAYNNAFNVMNDAFMFGNMVVKMYREYGVNCLESPGGIRQKTVLRVHYREKKCIGDSCDFLEIAQAFWDGKSANFGDGYGGNALPQVSLDIVAHELAHGFNESHANLEYHDESGALGEAFADISGIAAMDYVLRNHPELYNKIYPEAGGKIVWQIGSTVKADGQPKRYLDHPARDNESADCYDPTMTGSILYADVTFRAKLYFYSWSSQQYYIIHHGNGIFNLAFYILSNRWDVQRAFKAFVYASTHYWTPTVGFEEAANGVWRAAEKLGYNTDDVEVAFNYVGVDYR